MLQIWFKLQRVLRTLVGSDSSGRGRVAPGSKLLPEFIKHIFLQIAADHRAGTADQFRHRDRKKSRAAPQVECGIPRLQVGADYFFRGLNQFPEQVVKPGCMLMAADVVFHCRVDHDSILRVRSTGVYRIYA